MNIRLFDAPRGVRVTDVPEIELTDPEVLRDPFAAYGRIRERSPVARIVGPGFGPITAVTRHADTRALLTDPRFEMRAESFLRPAVPEDCLPYMRTMGELNGPEHARQRALVAPAFSARRAADFRPRIEPIVEGLLHALPDHVEDGSVDLLEHFTRPLPMAVICELVGIPQADRQRWREYGATIATGAVQLFAEAIPGIMNGAKAAIARRREEPGDDLLSDLIRMQAQDGDRLDDTELVTLVWHLVLAGQTPTNLIANAVAALFDHPEQLDVLRTNEELVPRAVDELVRWCGPALLAIPRYAREDAELHGAQVNKGDPVTATIASVNRDPRAFPEPDRFDIRRTGGPLAHLGFGHGPHFCLGASLAKTQTAVALSGLLRRFPDLALTAADRAPDPGTYRLNSLRVRL